MFACGLPQWSVGPTFGDMLKVVPVTADGFKATVRALQSLDRRIGVFPHLALRGRLLAKNLGKQMIGSVFCEEMETLNIRVQGVMELRLLRRGPHYGPPIYP